MIDTKDIKRNSLVHLLIKKAVLDGAEALFDYGVKTGDIDLLRSGKHLLLETLNEPTFKADNKPTNYKDMFQTYLKTVETVKSKGLPSKVARSECSIEDCPSCFFEAICEREVGEKLIDRSNRLVNQIMK